MASDGRKCYGHLIYPWRPWTASASSSSSRIVRKFLQKKGEDTLLAHYTFGSVYAHLHACHPPVMRQGNDGKGNFNRALIVLHSKRGDSIDEDSFSNQTSQEDDLAVEGNFDGKGFFGYLGPYILALFASLTVTALFVKFVLLDA